MFHSLRSTLTRFTIASFFIASFFTRYGKNLHEDEISIEQAIMCLETELGRPDSEKKRLDTDNTMHDSSVSATPVMFAARAAWQGSTLGFGQIGFLGSCTPQIGDGP